MIVIGAQPFESYYITSQNATGVNFVTVNNFSTWWFACDQFKEMIISTANRGC